MYNIVQITNYDIGPAGTVPKEIYYNGDKTKKETKTYREITKAMLCENDQRIGVSKLGYCTNDNKGINYPIFIKTTTSNNEYKPIYLGKTGMYEFQPEIWYDINIENDNTKEEKVYLIGILVPENVPFVLDYAYEV